jgi:hypothetical protein
VLTFVSSKDRPIETHYAYRVERSGSSYRDVATKTFNLAGVTSTQRRKLIDTLISEYGECLAKLPLKFAMIDKNRIDLEELTKFINGEFE